MGVLGFHWSSPKAGGVGVRSLTLSFDSTTNGSLGTKPVALKLDRIFSFENALSNTFAKVAMKAFLSILPMWSNAKPLISLGWLVGIDFRLKDGD